MSCISWIIYGYDIILMMCNICNIILCNNWGYVNWDSCIIVSEIDDMVIYDNKFDDVTKMMLIEFMIVNS